MPSFVHFPLESATRGKKENRLSGRWQFLCRNNLPAEFGILAFFACEERSLFSILGIKRCVGGCACVCMCVCVCVYMHAHMHPCQGGEESTRWREGEGDTQRDSVRACPSVPGPGAGLKQESMLQPQNCGFLCKFLNLPSSFFLPPEKTTGHI